MNQRHWSLIFAIFAMLALIWIRRPQPEPAQPPHHKADRLAPQSAAAPKAANGASELGRASEPNPVAAPTLQKPLPTPRDPHKPPAGAVPFDLINGWVVAYGDIALGKPASEDFPTNGFIEAPKLHLWEQAVIPFSIHAAVPNPERILRVIAYMNEYTPVRFVPYNGQADSLVFMPFDGLCLSYLGKTGGNQPIYLDDRCSEHEILHEVMHALGFIHEHSRSDRDQYVRVNWNNIDEDKVAQFDVTPPTLNEPLKGRPFDFHSVMIYPPTAFARDRSQPTLQALGDQAIEPTPNGLSAEDLERVRLLYSPKASAAPPTF